MLLNTLLHLVRCTIDAFLPQMLPVAKLNSEQISETIKTIKT